MIFSELYGAYYNAVARILKEACSHPLSKAEMRKIVRQEAFGESLLTIEPAILEERWQFLKADGTSPIRHAPSMPLTLLQKRWLKAIALDPRIRLFRDTDFGDPDTEPLFRPEDIDIYDRYSDGDPYADEEYIRRFRMILDAVRNQIPLKIEAVSPKGKTNRCIIIPERLEYSEKDDKFRLVGHDSRNQFVNLARITACETYCGEIDSPPVSAEPVEKQTVELELSNERNALERVLMHFAHFEKQAEKLDNERYKITISYNQEDETEMLIRVLAFGPVVRVSAPESFVCLIKERLLRQKRFSAVCPPYSTDTL